MKLHLMGATDEVMKGLLELESMLDFSLSADGAPIFIEKAENGLSVNSKVVGEKTEYHVTYSRIPEFFRAFAIVINAVKTNSSDISVNETAAFENCGISVDLSRNAVLKVSAFKDMIRRIALMGLTSVILYTEDVYRMDKYPYFGYMRGAYSEEELREIVDYAETFGIEAIPNIQTLGHLESTLRWSYADDMQDTCSVLLIDEPKTYEFIEEMFKVIRRCYKTDKIFIGMDEAHGVGTGRFLAINGYQDRFTILERHLGRVVEIAQKYDFSPAMFSDMFFRLGSENGYYYDTEAKMPENIEEYIPQNVSMVYWDYYHTDEAFYDAMIRNHRDLGRNIIFEGCVWTCNTYAVNYGQTFATAKAGLASCRKNNIKDVYATTWGDDGTESSVYNALLGFQLYAEYNYCENVTDEHLRKMFKICTGCDMDAFLLLDVDNFDASETDGILALTVSKQLLLQDILLGLMDKSFENMNFREHFEQVYEKLSKVQDQGELNYLFDLMRKYVKAVYKKSDIGIRLTKAYKENNREAMKNIVAEIADARAAFNDFTETYSEVWYKNNKPFGFERLDLRLGGVAARMDRAAERVTRYLNGDIQSIDELEEERLIYDGRENPYSYRTFSERYMSVSHPTMVII